MIPSAVSSAPTAAASSSTCNTAHTAEKLSCLLQEAIKFLQLQDYSEALRLLISGTEILDQYDCPEVFDEEEEEDQMMSMNDPYGYMRVTMVPLRLPTEENTKNTRTNDQGSNNDIHLVFRQAFYMEVNGRTTSWDLLSEDQHDAFGCIFLYNLGLTRHLKAMSKHGDNEDSSSSFMKQALQDYHGASGWLHGVQGMAGQWLALALANNSCLIQCHFFDRHEGSESLEIIHEQVNLLSLAHQRYDAKAYLLRSSSTFHLLREVACNYLFFRNALLSATCAPVA